KDVGVGVGPEHRPEPGNEAGTVMVSPCITGRGKRPAVVCIDGAGLLRKARREAALGRRIRRHARHADAPVLSPLASTRVCLRCIRLRELLPGKSTLLTRLVELLALRRTLRRWKPAKFAGLVLTQCALGPQLVACRTQLLTRIGLRRVGWRIGLKLLL